MTSQKNSANQHKHILGILTIALLSIAGTVILFSEPEASPTSAAAPPIPEAQVLTVSAEPVQTWQSFSGYIAAVESVDIRPRVGGAVQAVLFEEGSQVKKGDPLFIIDPRPFETEIASALAEKSSAQSRMELAQEERTRLEGLLQKRAVSKSLFDAAENDLKVAKAAMEAADARITRAKLNLEYAHIKAPVSGRISRAEITAGNLVEAGPNAPVLTTIVANEKVYAEFDMDEQSYILVAQSLHNREIPVTLEIGEQNPITFQGKLHAFDNRLDRTSGTIRARAIFENGQGLLVPGMFSKVKLGSPDREELLLIPAQAVSTDQARKFVYIIDENSQIAYREVNLGRFLSGKREVLSGLQAGDQILVNGLQRVRPGMKVQPVEFVAQHSTENPRS